MVYKVQYNTAINSLQQLRDIWQYTVEIQKYFFIINIVYNKLAFNSTEYVFKL